MFRKFFVLASLLICKDAVQAKPTFSVREVANFRYVLQTDTIEEKELTEGELKNFRNFRKTIGSVDTIDFPESAY